MQVSLALHIYYFKVPSLSGVKKEKHKKEDKQGKYFNCFFFSIWIWNWTSGLLKSASFSYKSCDLFILHLHFT